MRWRGVIAWVPLASPIGVVAATAQAPALSLPAPTGRFSIGTTVAYLVDERRRDPEFPDGRRVTLQLWYPAARSSADTAPYLAETGLDALLRRLQYADGAFLDAWAKLRTHSVRDAVPAPGGYALVAFSVGLGTVRANYTAIAEELSSHGYVMALVESPLQGVMVLPSGRTVVDTAGHYATPPNIAVG
jgi:predicted dienelactone hydrolase